MTMRTMSTRTMSMRIRSAPMAEPDDDDEEIVAYKRRAALREFNTMLRYWAACPNPACRRHRRCSGDVEMCHAIFWPVVPEEFKVWWGAICEARRDQSSLRQARRSADAARASWRWRQAQPPRTSI